MVKELRPRKKLILFIPLLVARLAVDSALGVADPHQASEGEGGAVDFNSRAGQYSKSHSHE